MTTITASEASQDLGKVLARALSGERIAIASQDGRIVALHPVEDLFEDASHEYGLSQDELDRSYTSVEKQVRQEKKAGKLRELK